MDAYGASDWWRASISRLDRMDAGPLDDHQARAQISGVITVQIEPHREHPDFRIAIQGAKSEHFYNASQAMHLDPPSQIRRSRIFRNGPSWTFHHNRRSFQSDGYAQKAYKRCVLQNSRHPSWDFNPIELSRHPLSRLSWFHPLPLSFSHPRRGSSQDLVENRRRNRLLNPSIAFFVFFAISQLNHSDLIAIGD